MADRPSGTGETIPFSCPNTSLALAAVGAPSVWTASKTALGEIWAAKQVMATGCKYEAGDIGELIGTAFTARDLMQVVEALDEDGMLRYWGFSYGTALGATVAAMFPDKMDRVVLDGVLNMDQYYAGKEIQQIVDADSTWAGFFSGCVKSPELCALAQNGSSAAELQKQAEDLLETVKFNPIALGLSVVDYKLLKSMIFTGLYVSLCPESRNTEFVSTIYPTLCLTRTCEFELTTKRCRYYTTYWPTLASAFHSIYTRNFTAWEEAVTTIFGIFASQGVYPQYHGAEALQGIRCSDTSLRTVRILISAIFPDLLDRFRSAGRPCAGRISLAILGMS